MMVKVRAAVRASYPWRRDPIGLREQVASLLNQDRFMCADVRFDLYP